MWCCGSENKKRIKRKNMYMQQYYNPSCYGISIPNEMTFTRQAQLAAIDVINHFKNERPVNFYGRPMNNKNAMGKRYNQYNNNNQHESGYVCQGNIYNNSGYTNSGDIYGKNNGKNNQYSKKEAKHSNNQSKQTGDNGQKSFWTLDIYHRLTDNDINKMFNN